MGFLYLPTAGKEVTFGHRTGEIDAVFIFENIILVVEDTTRKNPFDHAKSKRHFAERLLMSKEDFVNWLMGEFPEFDNELNAYTHHRFALFYLYISKHDMDLTEDDLKFLEPMRVMTTRARNYFERLSKTIRKSARTDLWRFLQLTSGDIGLVNASNGARTIETTIISPDDSTGFNNGVRLVSFMISADVLLRNSYVLRKDNWDYAADLYQRLIDTNRIKKIRQYIASDGAAFLNNIIIGLPADVTFQTADKAPIRLDDIQNYSSHRMIMPDEFNSLCIIDGQHRVFAHYEGADALESKVAAIRSRVHLLATGLVFPKDMGESERIKLQSEIFLAINSNTKPVPADVLLAIQSLRAPYDEIAVARRVLEALNRKSTFRGMFQLSQMDQAPIKIASIVKFALRYLVDIDADDGLFSEWSKDDLSREELRAKSNSDLLVKYVDYCASTLDSYFGALKSRYPEGWGDPESKITSTTVVNGMIIALRRSLPSFGVLTFDEYSDRMQDWDVDFSKLGFPFSSSQYGRFSHEVLSDLFGITEVNGNWVRRE